MRQLKISGVSITNRTENTSRYFTEVERNKLLSTQDEWEIGIRAQAGDPAAIDQLVKANLRFVISVAKQYSSSTEKLEDLISQGNIGLIHAARTFDPSRGFKFISYAVWHIRKEIMQHLISNLRQIRLPQNIISSMSKIKKAQDQLYQIEGRQATLEELSEWFVKTDDTDLTVERLRKIHDAMYQRTSPLENTDDPDGFSQLSVLSSADTRTNLDSESLDTVADGLFKCLPPIGRVVVSHRLGFFDNETWTFNQIAEKIGKTSETARQIYNKSIRMVKRRALKNPALLNQLKELV